MSELIIRVLGRDGTVILEKKMQGRLSEAGVNATKLLWDTQEAGGYEVWEGNRAVISLFPRLNPMPPDPLLREEKGRVH